MFHKCMLETLPAHTQAVHRKGKKACMHTCIRTRCCDLHTSARTSASGGSAFHRPLFSCYGEKEREGLRVRPVPLSRLVSNSSSPSRQACAGLWLGSPAARLGLWNNRRPPGRLGGVCEPRLWTGAHLAEWCVLANTQLVCLPHANGPAFTTAHAIGSRRPEEHQAGLNKRPPPPLSRSSFSVSSPPLATILHFFLR